VIHGIPPTTTPQGTTAPEGAPPETLPEARAPIAPAESILSGLPARRIPSADHTARRDCAVGPSVKTRAGKATGLHGYAVAAREIASGVARAELSRPCLLSRAASAAKSLIGIANDVDWMRSAMRGLRADAAGAGVDHAAPAPTDALRALRESTPIAAFWTRPEIAAGASWGPHKDEVIAELERIGLEQSPRLALAISFACLAAEKAQGGDAVHLGGGVFRALAEPTLIRQIVANEGVAASSADVQGLPPATLRMARRVLEHCAHSNQFEQMARALGVADAQLPTLKRYLLASEVARQEPPPTGNESAADIDAVVDAMESAQASRGLSLAARVRDTARMELQSAGAARLSPRQMAEAFYWDNGFHNDAPGSELHQFKQHFFEAVEQMGRSPEQAGPIKSAHLYGLAGANRHLLADEANKLMSLVGTPQMDALVDDIQVKLTQALEVERATVHDPAGPPSANVARMLAIQLALREWSPALRDRLSLEDIVHGRAYGESAGGSDPATLAALCDRFVSGGPLTPAQAPTATDLSAARPTVDSSALRVRVQAELTELRLGFDSLAKLAELLGVELTPQAQAFVSKVQGTINGESPHPAGLIEPSEEVAQMMAKFLAHVQFGNHVKWSHLDAMGATTRGYGGNFAPGLRKFKPKNINLTRTPLLIRADFGTERSVEHVIRAGAATHGGELFMGRDLKHRHTAGAGAQIGHTDFGRMRTLGRIAGGLDGNYTRNDSSYHGAMFRVNRRIVSETQDQDRPEFVQSDADTRTTMSQLAKLLFSKAPNAKTDEQREQLLEEAITYFGHHGLSMSLIDQRSAANRSEFAVGGGVSIRTPGVGGARLGLAGAATYDKTWNSGLAEKDSTGSYQINNVRVGWSAREKLAGDLGIGLVAGPVGGPLLPLASTSAMFADTGGSVRVRMPTLNGNIVAEKSFSDTETADPRFFRDIVLSDKQKWIDLFAYAHRDQDPQAAQAEGEARVDEFLHKIETLRNSNHQYYARERMHPDVAQRLDELAAIESLVPAEMASFRAELSAKRAALASDDRAWGAASLIAFERVVQQDGQSVAPLMARASRVSAVEGEREFIFDTPGWANLRQRERDHPPRWMDE
jgi:hypothetical protein